VRRRPGRAVDRCRVQGPGEDPPRPVRVHHSHPDAGEAGMNQSSPELTELRALLDALCDETITPEQVRRLEELVLAHPEAEAYYVEFMSLHADLVGRFSVVPSLTEESLRDRAGTAEEEPGQPACSRFRVFRSAKFLVPLSALAAGLLVAVVMWPRPGVTPEPS